MPCKEYPHVKVCVNKMGWRNYQKTERSKWRKIKRKHCHCKKYMCGKEKRRRQKSSQKSKQRTGDIHFLHLTWECTYVAHPCNIKYIQIECMRKACNGAQIKEVNYNIKMYRCTLVMVQQNAEKRHSVGIVFWTGIKSRITIISWNFRVLGEKDEKRGGKH
jgi:hypothetical protein